MTDNTWQEKIFNDCAVLVRNTVSPQDASDSLYIGLEHISEGALYLIGHGTANDVSSVKSRFNKGDILFGKLRPYFRKVIRAPFNGVCSTDIWVVQAKEGIDQGFLYYLMASDKFVDNATKGSEGTKMPRAKWDYVTMQKWYIPPLSEQRAIAHILGTLDDKIELNRRMNETLEAMAQAIFKSWFIDFDPIHVKVEGRDTGLPKEIADLFPDSFEESEIGRIPKGWKAVSLQEIIEVNPSRSLHKGDIAPYLDMSNMPTHGHSPNMVYERPFSSGMRFINGDTLLARITPCLENGKTAYVDFLKEGQIGWGSTEFIVLRSKPPLPTEYAYFLARSQRFREFAIQSMIGSSGRQRVPTSSLPYFITILPPKQITEQFGKLVEPLFARQKATIIENGILNNVRDTLLPKLISGELRIPNPERFLRSVSP
ncbi:MAG: restriction endonuclease subunit S [Caulobacteraceae bacterium]